MQSINTNKEVTLFYANCKQEQKVTLCRVETRTKKQLCVQYKQQQRSNSMLNTSNIKEVTMPKRNKNKEATLCSVQATTKK